VSGSAPLAVLFDATGTTVGSGNAFHFLSYQFNFGDERGQAWATSGLPKNSQSGGPLAAHVYDLPGTYLVTLSARSATGEVSQVTTTVTVSSPDSVWAGAATVCVSSSGSFSGCPSGAAQQATLPSIYTGKRVLLRREESFGAVNIERGASNVLVGAFGSGSKPVVSSVMINAGRMSASFASDVTVTDLSVSNGIVQADSASRVLLYRNDLTRPGGNNSIVFASALGYMFEQNPSIPFFNPREIFVVENNVLGQVNNTRTPFMNLSGQGSRVVVMGNDMARSEEHTSRLFSLHKSIVAHNALRGQSYSASGASIRSTMKIHSGGLLPYADLLSANGGDWATSQLVVADNLLGDATNNGSFTAGVGPQNRIEVEGIEDVIIERNRFVRGSYTNTEMENNGRRFTYRGNTRSDGGPLNLSVGDKPAMPTEWRGPYWYQ
jgi:PKD domain